MQQTSYPPKYVHTNKQNFDNMGSKNKYDVKTIFRNKNVIPALSFKGKVHVTRKKRCPRA